MGYILGIVIAVIGVAFIASAAYFSNKRSKTASRICTVLALIAIVVFATVPFSVKTVDTGEVAVVKNLGKIKTVRTAGTYFDFWLTNEYITYDAKVQNVNIATAAYSSDAQTMDIQMTLQYQIVADKVADITQQYGTLETLQTRIQSIAIEKTKAVLSGYKAMDIIAQRASMSPAVETVITDAIGNEYFVNVVAVVLTNIDFSDAFETAVEEKMIAEQAKLKAEYENETKIAQAAAEAEAKLKAAQAEIDIAKAKAEALKIEAEAEAEANKILTDSLTEEVLKTIFYEKWDGKLPLVMGNGDYILPGDIFTTEE